MVGYDDVRLRDQAAYLLGARLRRVRWEPHASWDLDRCEFCLAPFLGSAQPFGYVTLDGRWICATCFEDFRQGFGFVLVEEFA